MAPANAPMEKFRPPRRKPIDLEGCENQAKLAKPAEIGKLPAPLKIQPPSTIPPRNPYRAILRREYPEPFIALLAFILGIWLWDHYFGKSQGYPPGTEEIALVKIDRDLRLADAMADDPAWLRWLAGVDDPDTERGNALAVLQNLATENSISLPGLEAFAIIKAEQEGLPVRETLAEVMQGQTISDFMETSDRLANHQGTWWQREIDRDLGKNHAPGAPLADSPSAGTPNNSEPARSWCAPRSGCSDSPAWLSFPAP